MKGALSMYKLTNANIAEVISFCDSKDYVESAKNTFGRWMGVDSYDELKKSCAIPLKRDCTSIYGKSHTTQIENSVCGFLPNVPAYLNNEPMNMFYMEAQNEVRLISINLFICLPASVNSSEIERNGKILAEYIEKNTTDKDRFQVNFISAAKKYHTMNFGEAKHENGITVIKVCEHDDYITDSLLKLITLPAFYRYYMLGFENKAHGHTKYNINSKCTNLSDLLLRSEMEPYQDTMDYMDMENNVKKLISKYN